jgi:hypothetical protein
VLPRLDVRSNGFERGSRYFHMVRLG